MFNLGTDSLGRDLFQILIESILNSVVIGSFVSLIVLIFLAVSLFIVLKPAFSNKVFGFFMLIDHIIPKYLFLILLSSFFRNYNIIGISAILSIFFVISSVNQILSFSFKNYHTDLRMYHSSLGLSPLIIVKSELFPLVKLMFAMILSSVFLQSIILEAVLTFIGVGLEFGTPSLGFILSDGLSSLNRNPLEIGISFSIIVFLSVLLSYFLKQTK